MTAILLNTVELTDLVKRFSLFVFAFFFILMLGTNLIEMGSTSLKYSVSKWLHPQKINNAVVNYLNFVLMVKRSLKQGFWKVVGKKVKLCGIFRDKFVEKLADFTGILWKFLAQICRKAIGKKQPILWLFSGQISQEWGCLMKGLRVFSWSFLFPQLLKGVTIASGGVLPNIHPELLKKRKGGKLVAPEELKPKKPRTSTAPKPKAGTSGKKMPASPAKKTPEKSQASGKGKKKGVSTVFKTESTKKLSNLNFQWTKTLYQNNLKHIAFFFTFFKGYKDVIIVICNNSKEIFLWELEKMNVKFHKITPSYSCDFQNFNRVFTILLKVDIHFLGLPWEVFFVVINYRWLITSLGLEKCKKECNIF